MKAPLLTLTLLLPVLPALAAPVTTNAPVLPCCCHAELPASALPGTSVYQTDSTWTTDDNRQLKLRDLAGKPQVVLMFYSHCTTACPILANDIRRIAAALTPEQRAAVGFTLVSFDSDRDTPATLAEYRKNWNLPVNWTLLDGKADDVLELAALLGVQYKQNPDGQFLHSNAITLLNAKGEIVFQQTGLDTDPKEMIRQIESLLTPGQATGTPAVADAGN